MSQKEKKICLVQWQPWVQAFCIGERGLIADLAFMQNSFVF
jgi:hypothetical protein